MAGTRKPRITTASQNATRKITTPAAIGCWPTQAISVSSVCEFMGGDYRWALLRGDFH